MSNYLVSFPSAAMVLSPDELRLAGEESRALVREAKAAGVWVFGGGMNESVPPVRVDADGTVTEDTYPQTRELDGGFAVLRCETRDEALEWARRFAATCRCAQEVRVFWDDPES